ncbi:MAG: hypothetical protein KJS92_08725, partial [Bacteroidetes bacterium]|nr:hypothetical protein [Bacteroidota bacterium]
RPAIPKRAGRVSTKGTATGINPDQIQGTVHYSHDSVPFAGMDALQGQAHSHEAKAFSFAA